MNVVMVMMVVTMSVRMIMRVLHRETARTSAESIAVDAIFDIRPRRARALTLNMMMVTLLRRANLCLKPQHLRAIFAQCTIHQVLTAKDLCHPLGKGRDDLRMVVEISGFDELNVRVLSGNLVRKTIDAVDQDTGEQEVREDNDALETKLRNTLQARLYQWKGNAGITGFGPTKAHTFPKHPRYFCDI